MIAARLRAASKYLGVLAFVLALLACETEKVEQTHSGIQQNLFLQSLGLVESAGSLLQRPNPDASTIELAMQQMDQGLRKAYEVEQAFLQQLDVRLPKHYADSFIVGVENYRIGVEAADRNQQLRGLDHLSRWSNFWSTEKSAILLKMTQLTGLPLQQSEDYRAAEKQFKLNQSTTEVTY